MKPTTHTNKYHTQNAVVSSFRTSYELPQSCELPKDFRGNLLSSGLMALESGVLKGSSLVNGKFGTSIICIRKVVYSILLIAHIPMDACMMYGT